MEWSNIYSMEQLGAFLKQYRRAHGVTQAQYAEQLGISHATLSALENGRGVSCTTLEKAFQLLGLRLIVLPKDAEARVTLRTAREG